MLFSILFPHHRPSFSTFSCTICDAIRRLSDIINNILDIEHQKFPVRGVFLEKVGKYVFLFYFVCYAGDSSHFYVNEKVSGNHENLLITLIN
jgi:hypothetical protein